MLSLFCFFHDPATTEIYTDGHPLSLLVALPFLLVEEGRAKAAAADEKPASVPGGKRRPSAAAPVDEAVEKLAAKKPAAKKAPAKKAPAKKDRKSTRLNSSH